MEHPTNMFPMLQEIELDNVEIIGSINGYQYDKQPYLSRQYDGQQFGSSEITSTTVPTTTTTTSSTVGQFTFDGRVDEAVECKELPQQPAPQPKPKLVNAESELKADSLVQQQARAVPLPFPTRTVSTRKFETNEDLLKMFQRVEINILLLDAIKQISKSHNWITISLAKEVLRPRIFSVPCTIGDCTFTDAMLDLGASINVMSSSIYKSLNFGDLEPMGIVIQLANRSVVQPLGKDVLVQVNELVFLADFYVLDMEDEMFGKGSTLILGRPFLMTA
ncbi:hypothetical protein CR513_43989, partial [Mucuna pruriens]